MSECPLPANWSNVPLSTIVATLQSGVSVNAEDRPCSGDESGVLKTSAVNGGKFARSENKVIVDRAENKRARLNPRKDSILISRMNTFDLVGESAYVDSDYLNLFVPDRLWLTVMRNPDATSVKWLSYVVRDPQFRHAVSNAATGTSGSMKNISQNSYLNISVRLPPLPQQLKIAQILTTLDNVIEKTEALIAKYQAIKQGLMRDLFTRGVDATGKLRPPQSEAPELYKQSNLGWIPKDWEVTTVGDVLISIDAGKSPDCPDRPATSGEWGVLKVSAVQPDGFLSIENKVVQNPNWVNPAYEVHDGDLLISRCNTYQLVGLVCLVRSPQPRLMICDKTLRLRVDPRRATVEFLFWLMQQAVVRRHIEVHATGTSGTMKNISQPSVRSAAIMLPSITEQTQIASRIQAIEQRIRSERRTQDKLRTQKIGLMQDLLTGKVSVKADEPKEIASHA